MSWGLWLGVALGALMLLAIFRRPLRLLGKLAVRWGVAMAVLWGLQGIGPSLGVYLGCNALNGLVLGVLGVPGFGLLLLTQWVFR